MKKIFPVRSVLRALSVAAVLEMLAAGSLLAPETGIMHIVCLSFCSGLMVLLFYPLSYETLPLSKWSAIAYAAALPLPFALHRLPGLDGAALFLGLSGVFLVAYVALRLRERYSMVQALVRNNNPLHGVEEYSMMYARLIFLLLLLLSTVPGAVVQPPLWYGALSLAVAVLYVFLYRSCYIGRAIFLRKKCMDEILSAIRDESDPVKNGGKSARMGALYTRAVDCMERKKLYLQEDFDIDDLARILVSNRTYLSRTINFYSGRNFKQFVNFYRIRYAAEAIRADPRLSTIEVAVMCGFHSVVTFNMAFRLFMDTTPGAYAKDIVARRNL